MDRPDVNDHLQPSPSIPPADCRITAETPATDVDPPTRSVLAGGVATSWDVLSTLWPIACAYLFVSFAVFILLAMSFNQLGLLLMGAIWCVASVLVVLAIPGPRDAMARQLLKPNKGGRFWWGHFGRVNCVAVSPDGQFVLSGGNDGTIRLWKVETGEERRQLTGHVLPVRCVAFSPDGGSAASASGNTSYGPEPARFRSPDPAIRFWELMNGTQVHHSVKHSHGVNALAYAPDGRRLLSASSDGTIRLCDPATGQEIRCLAMRTAAGGSTWVSVYEPAKLSFWQRQERRFFEPTTITALALAPDGNTALVGGPDNLVVVDLARAVITKVLKDALDAQSRVWLLPRQVESVAISPDGRRALSGMARRMQLWDLENGSLLHVFQWRAGDSFTRPVRSVVFAPDGRRALVGSADGAVRLLDLETKQVLRCFVGHGVRLLGLLPIWAGVNGVAFSPDGRQAVSCGDDWTIRVWELEV